MKTVGKLSCLLVVLIVAIVTFSALLVPGPGPEHEIPVYGYEVVHSYPHDRFAFTEGLAWDGGILIESTGLKGGSTLRQVNLTTGEVIRVRHLADRYFGEGMTVLGTKIIQLTYDSHTGFIDDLGSLEPLGTFNYSTMGWGIAWDGKNLIMSDGSSTLYFLDTETYREVRRIDVTAMGEPVGNLNELEYVHGMVYTNVWPTNRIAIVSPDNGEVTGWIDLSGLLSDEAQEQAGRSGIENYPEHPSAQFDKEECLNGIAYDPDSNRLFVTGKFWPRLYEIRVVPG
jgi:glutamine cyclotransferase